MAKKTTEYSEKTENKTVVYIGNNYTGISKNNIAFRVKSNTIFSNGLTKEIKEKCEDDPVFKRLFVPVDRLSESLKKTKKGGW